MSPTIRDPIPPPLSIVSSRTSAPTIAAATPPPPKTVRSGFTSSMMIRTSPLQPPPSPLEDPATVNRAPSAVKAATETPWTSPVVPPSPLPEAIGSWRPSA